MITPILHLLIFGIYIVLLKAIQLKINDYLAFSAFFYNSWKTSFFMECNSFTIIFISFKKFKSQYNDNNDDDKFPYEMVA